MRGARLRRLPMQATLSADGDAFNIGQLNDREQAALDVHVRFRA